MKIGIYNIFTLFWFLELFLCGGLLIYWSIEKNLFASDLIFIAKFVVGFLILICVAVFFFFLYKFRMLIIDGNKMISLRIFLLKKETIDLTQIKKVKMENFFAFKEVTFRRIKISDLNGTLEISDLEFENFDKLVSHLKLNQNRKAEIDLEQAKSNRAAMNSNVYLLIGLLIFLVFNTIWNSGFHYIILIFFICNVILLYASLKRKLKYKGRMENRK